MNSRSVAAVVTAAGLVVASLAGAAVASAQARHHVAGDFDGDGRTDLAIGGSGVVRVSYTHARPHGSSVAVLSGGGGFGRTIAIGDVNGDGYADLLVGAPYTMHPADPSVGDGVAETMGAVVEYLGSAAGLHRGPVTITGPYDGDEPYSLGAAIAAADVNGDGYADLAVSVPEADADNLRIYRGGPHGLSMTGFTSLDGQGPTALAFSDVNGDGRPELVAGPAYLNGNGILVFRNTGHGLSTGSPQQFTDRELGVYRNAGTALVGGDINGDGYGDVIVGAPDDAYYPHHPSPGHIIVLRGSAHGLSAGRRQTLSESVFTSSSHDGDGFGAALAIAHVTGRHDAEVIVGAPSVPVGQASGAGAVFVLRGASYGVAHSHAQRFTQATPGVPGAASANAGFGTSVFALHANTDRYADVVVGAPGSNYGSHDGGAAIRFFGAASGLTVRHAHAVAGMHSGWQLGLALG